MQKSQDVLDKRELKELKLSKEGDLLNRIVNISNHCLSHKFSGCCLKGTQLFKVYIITAHGDIPQDQQYILNSIEYVKCIIKECMMKYGKPLLYNPSGENNLKRGIPINKIPYLDCNSNGFCQFIACRNHPRIIKGPNSSLYCGANIYT